MLMTRHPGNNTTKVDCTSAGENCVQALAGWMALVVVGTYVDTAAELCSSRCVSE
jgi:hypothetical protein